MKIPLLSKSTTYQILDQSDREFILNNTNLKSYRNNQINTSKYNFLTFLPKNLIEQFTKLANFYFLIIGFLQTFHEISSSGGVPVILFPLTIIIIVSGAKDLFEDLKRRRSDNQENSRLVDFLSNTNYIQRSWEDIIVGNIIKIKENEYFPADILLLKSSDPKNICYIETKNLDGETNLKRKLIHKDLWGLKENQLSKLDWNLQYEKPNPFLYTFKGNINKENGKIPLDNSNFILRGCSLRNTQWIIGVVLYTGHETKIMLNSTKARPKNSSLMNVMNRQIAILFIFQLIFCLFSAFYAVIWYHMYGNDLKYMEFNKLNGLFYFFWIKYGTWLIIFQNFVPISLIVTLEMVKFVQGIFISNDEKLKTNLNPLNGYVSVHTSSLNEELGQISHIFSDKTGTLTCNFMEFKCVSIYGISYGEDRNEKIENKPIVTNVDFRDKRFFEELRSGSNRIKETLAAIALCHTVIVETNENNELIYNASSPDELALLNWARFCGYEFLGIDNEGYMLISYDKEIFKYQLLHVLEFNSQRKRQSVILKTLNNEIILYVKGADSIIEDRLINKNDENKIKTWENLEKYASIGLRTLVIAKRILDINEYEKWAEEYLEVSSSLINREEKMETLQDSIEIELELIAATAIEDKLQDQVGVTIDYLKQTGIKFWMLTGDKIETAINIGYSCQLLNENQTKLLIDSKEQNKIQNDLDEKLNEISKNTLDTQFSLIISGDSLIHALKPPLNEKLLNLSEACRAIIACRVSPKQKQELVALIKTHRPKSITLAIGDGANDVNMITAAHVGIGIRGVEGQQAARASDYVIGEFKFLRRLMLYYGRESYRRNSNVICYNFYKNMVLVLPQFWFGMRSGFSGQNIYNVFIYQLYNIIFASMPIVIYGLLDKEYTGNFLTNQPTLYIPGIKKLLFNKIIFWKWILSGIVQAFIITLPCFYILDQNFTRLINNELGFWDCGMAIFGAVIVVTNLKIFIFSYTYSIFSVIANFISFASYFIIFWIASDSSKPLNDLGSAELLYKNYSYYFYMIGTIIICFGIDLAIERCDYFNVSDRINEKIKREKNREKEIELEVVSNRSSNVNKKYTGYAYSQEEPPDNFQTYAEN